jgi:hypothetical protein
MEVTGHKHIVAQTNTRYFEKIAVINDVCSLLDDGKWHVIDEIGKEVGLSPIFVKFVLDFLRKYQFVEMSVKSEGKARMKKGTPRLEPAVRILKALLGAGRATATPRQAQESKKCIAKITTRTDRSTLVQS